MKNPGVWGQAGGACQYEPGGLWWAAVPKERWPEDGDEALEAMWNGALLTDAEMALGQEECLAWEGESAHRPHLYNSGTVSP